MTIIDAKPGEGGREGKGIQGEKEEGRSTGERRVESHTRKKQKNCHTSMHNSDF